jgi:hypothetical protein
MAWHLARVIVPDFLHHIILRGSRRLETFFANADYREYLMAEWCNRLAMRPFWTGLKGLPPAY